MVRYKYIYNNKKKIWHNKNLYIVILIVLVMSAYIYSSLSGFLSDLKDNQYGNEVIQPGSAHVHYIDVWQGDCILIQDGIHNILIDTGSSIMSSDVLNFFDKHDVDKLDMVILTHPHEDHIGSFDEIAEKYQVDLVLKSGITHDTSTYRNVEKILTDEDIKAIVPVYKEIFTYGDMMFTVLSDSSKKYDEINDYSIVVKLDHLGNTFLFTADMESSSEKDLLDKRTDIECDVLKVAHHGGSSSTTASFLYEASPVYAIIQSGAGNDYGYPHKSIMERLDVHAVKVYRNDLLGDITCISTDKGISFIFEKDY
jgi:beta-lactamase superfamily II metal-dependent hydrolase